MEWFILFISLLVFSYYTWIQSPYTPQIVGLLFFINLVFIVFKRHIVESRTTSLFLAGGFGFVFIWILAFYFKRLPVNWSALWTIFTFAIGVLMIILSYRIVLNAKIEKINPFLVFLPFKSLVLLVSAIFERIGFWITPNKEVYQKLMFDSNSILLSKPVVEKIESNTPSSPPKFSLLDLLTKNLNIFVIGKKGSGKSTILMEVTKIRREMGFNVIVIDPHSYKDQWKYANSVFGSGKDFDKIESVIELLHRESINRYQKLKDSDSPLHFEPICIVIDELTEVSNNIDNAEVLKELLNCRKVDISIVCGGHSDNSQDMGLTGSYNLIKNYDLIINIEYSIFTKERKYLVDIQPTGKKREYYEANYDLT